MKRLQPTDADLSRVCDFVYRRTGLVYGDNKRYYAERRVTQRMQATGAADFATYYARLGFDADEAEALVNAFTINETYFYREKHQLMTLSSAMTKIVSLSIWRPSGSTE